MHRTLPFSLDDLAADHKSVQATLNDACSKRRQKYWLRGVAQVEDHVYFFLLPRVGNSADEDYVLAPLPEIPSHQDMIGILDDRWAAGFDMIGSCRVYETLFLVFARGRGAKRS